MKVGFRYELLNKRLQKKLELESVVSGSISFNSGDKIPKTARITVIDDGKIDFNNQVRLKIIMELRDSEDYRSKNLGVFVLASPEQKIENRSIIREVEAYDLTQLLDMVNVGEGSFFDSGMAYTDCIGDLIGKLDFLEVNITESDKVLSESKEFEPNKSILDCVNEMLVAIGYEPLHADEEGVLIVAPPMDLKVSNIRSTFSDSDGSIISGSISHTLDYFNAPNRYVAVVSNAEKNLYSIWENDDGSSPISTKNKDLVTKVLSPGDIADQATLDSFVKEEGIKDTLLNSYGKVSFETPLYFSGYKNLYRIISNQIGIDGYFEEISWEMDLNAHSTMKRNFRRV